jgi:hypothetical protein
MTNDIDMDRIKHGLIGRFLGMEFDEDDMERKRYVLFRMMDEKNWTVTTPPKVRSYHDDIMEFGDAVKKPHLYLVKNG